MRLHAQQLAININHTSFFIPPPSLSLFLATGVCTLWQGFHWSIDHLARLKPAEIDTDPVSLVKTNGESPENDGERQGVADLFFSQRSILPSPWPTSGRQRSNLRQGLTPRLLPGSALTPVAHPKKVTFSPHPPSTAYISSSDCMEVDNKENALVNVATQTCITIPFSCDLRELLGPGFSYGETDGGVRDLANSSLRRKLFGQPNRGDSGTEEEEEEEEEERKEEGGKVENDPPLCTDLTPMRCVSGDCSHLSSTPLKSRTSHCPHPHTSSSSPLIFSAHLPTSSCHPTTSSLVLTPGVNLPQLSPIENDSRGTREGSKGNCESCKRLFSSLSPNPQSRSGPHPTPSPPTCPPFSPILSHSAGVGVASCDGVRSAGGGNGGGGEPLVSRTPCRVSNNTPSKATSTPYCNGVDLVRQQQMMTGGTGTKADLPTSREKPARREEGEEEGGGSGNSSEDAPQPISLGDLQTYYDDDLTSVTGITTCTSYFTRLATDDSRSASDRQPLHSTVAIQNLNPQISVPDPHWGAGRLRLPSIREISRINNEPSMTGTATDSGVAGSLDFNQPPGASLGNSRGPENSANAGSLMEQEKDNKATSYKNSQPPLAKSEVDSGLVPSPDHTHGDHAHIGHTPRKCGAVNHMSKAQDIKTNHSPKCPLL
ncbi:Protein aurora borealis [Geodia barretti]|uniref:Protein aurora borealis n=1 Tax=Geodia barretti TaxID=519541 RepID=A0AA35X5J3_GEOBA|nr:Protein aurora borealis [Geodia barretti]